MNVTQATRSKVGRFHGQLTDNRTLEPDEVSMCENIETLALHMTADHGRSRRYWLSALTTGEDN
jgi:hypothetical protein